MKFLLFGLRQTATYWQVTGYDGYNEPVFAAPVQIRCRWEYRVEKVQNDDGQEVVSKARVFLDREVSTDDFIALGTFADADPRRVFGAWRVLTFRSIPSLDGKSFERKCYI